MTPIYLDYNATTPVEPAVAEAISHALRELWGNPSSSHGYGKAAQEAIETARGQVAALIGAQPDEIVFTGGGSEASNQAIKGTCLLRLSEPAPHYHNGRGASRDAQTRRVPPRTRGNCHRFCPWTGSAWSIPTT